MRHRCTHAASCNKGGRGSQLDNEDPHAVDGKWAQAAWSQRHPSAALHTSILHGPHVPPAPDRQPPPCCLFLSKTPCPLSAAVLPYRCYVVYDAMGSRDRADHLEQLGGGAAVVFSGLSEADTYIGAAALHWKGLGADEVRSEGYGRVGPDRRGRERGMGVDRRGGVWIGICGKLCEEPCKALSVPQGAPSLGGVLGTCMNNAALVPRLGQGPQRRANEASLLRDWLYSAWSYKAHHAC